jgi:hypothetical protein
MRFGPQRSRLLFVGNAAQQGNQALNVAVRQLGLEKLRPSSFLKIRRRSPLAVISTAGVYFMAILQIQNKGSVSRPKGFAFAFKQRAPRELDHGPLSLAVIGGEVVEKVLVNFLGHADAHAVFAVPTSMVTSSPMKVVVIL